MEIERGLRRLARRVAFVTPRAGQWDAARVEARSSV